MFENPKDLHDGLPQYHFTPATDTVWLVDKWMATHQSGDDASNRLYTKWIVYSICKKDAFPEQVEQCLFNLGGMLEFLIDSLKEFVYETIESCREKGCSASKYQDLDIETIEDFFILRGAGYERRNPLPTYEEAVIEEGGDPDFDDDEPLWFEVDLDY